MLPILGGLGHRVEPSVPWSEPLLHCAAMAERDETQKGSSEQASGPTRGEGRWRAPLGLYLACASVYVAVLGARAFEPSPNNHYAHLAWAWLHGQTHLVGNRPPGTNDWACFDVETRGPCPPGFRVGGPGDARHRWFVSFPPLPAVVLLPAVALAGGPAHVPDRLIWALVAAAAPALLYVLLRRLSEEDESIRSARENLGLALLFAFGTVFFFVAVQGSVWFAAHVLASVLLMLHLFWGHGARRPALAGLMLGLSFLTRPTTAFLCLFFGVEALRCSRSSDAPVPEEGVWWLRRLLRWLAGVRWREAWGKVLRFSLPVLLCGGAAMLYNQARFGDPFEFGHRYLQIGWRGRIERWGLFNYHYVARNLAVLLASLPWLSARPPYLKVGLHGLALWFTTPNLLLVLWPRRAGARYVALALGIAPVLLLDLAYQNSGWVQFGYRFALDWLPLAFVMLAIGERRFGPGFWASALFAVAVNTFGALTFDRAWEFYDDDWTQKRLFQPD